MADADADHDGNHESRPLLAAASEQVGDSNPQAPASAGGSTFKRNLGVLDAFAIVISIVIGSGVFTSPGAIDTNVPSPLWALLAWFVGGVLAWSGAMTMAELGTAIPGEGGVQPYLVYVYGDILGFLAAWTWVVAVMPATLAILSIVFVESIFSAAGVVGGEGLLGHKLASVGVMATINLANCVSTRASTRLNGFFVVTKFVAIVGVVVAGLVVVILYTAGTEEEVGGRDWHRKSWAEFRDTIGPDGTKTHWEDLSSWDMLGHFSAALYGALWAYSGWEKVCRRRFRLMDAWSGLTCDRPSMSRPS
jgi:solute carrier family 7 (L-type amino acid transporter), member 9/15